MVAHGGDEGMDMDMDMGGGDSSSGPLSATGVDFSDPDQASEFLEALLNDDQLKVIGNAYARYFWYGVIVVIGIASLFKIARWLTLQMRYVVVRGIHAARTDFGVDSEPRRGRRCNQPGHRMPL